MSVYHHIQIPSFGLPIEMKANKVLHVPHTPIIPFIEGDGSGRDIWQASVRVLDSAVEKAYGKERRLAWMEVYAGNKATKIYGEHSWLPQETIEAFRQFLVGLKGPISTPPHVGVRSLNTALRQDLDLYACLRPLQYFPGTPSPVKDPEKINLIIFRENCEDVYAGIEWPAGSENALQVLEFLHSEFPKYYGRILFANKHAINEWHGKMNTNPPEEDWLQIGIGIKPISKLGCERLVRAAIEYAIQHQRKSVTLVHKGNIMKHTEGSFRDWGYALAEKEFAGRCYTWSQWELTRQLAGEDRANEEQSQALEEGKILIKDVLADISFQQILSNPEHFDVIATLNLNGNYLSEMVAAQTGGIEIAPGANINFATGHAIFEVTHGILPKYANLDMANPSSLILSGEMLLRYLGWHEAADLVQKGLKLTIQSQQLTVDFAKRIENSTEIKCSAFADGIIANM